ncbi:MAG: serine/threonine-protein phosphatase [Phycisphaerales bacterium]|nr:serine/threonine-protein phosphatase [Phycisphaerales bacterium]
MEHAAEETTLFRQEYEQELDLWLQRRFGYMCIGFAVIELLGVALSSTIYGVLQISELGRLGKLSLMSAILGLAGLIVTAFYYRRRMDFETRQSVLRATAQLILILGGLALIETILQRLMFGHAGPGALAELFLWHFSACLFLPWRPAESIRPMVPLLAAWAVVAMFAAKLGERTEAVLSILLSPAILLPGLAVTALRIRSHGRRFRTRMVGSQFIRMRTELTQARALQEAMFPPRHDDGCVRLEYAYTPMRDVGGDYIHLAIGPTGTVSITVIDVTGHGLAAAMTVNRLFGELERVRAEDAAIQPVQVLTAINRYIHLTLSRHNIYATAVCFDVDPYVGELRYANAGHPASFIRPITGVLRELESTGMLLGVVPDESFDCQQVRVPLVPGDVIIAFTDGLVEAMNRRGEQFGIDRVREALRRTPPPDRWPEFLVSLADRHLAGQRQDDVLVAAVRYLNVRMPRTRAVPDRRVTV